MKAFVNLDITNRLGIDFSGVLPEWTPGSSPFKNWCSSYFGPDADESYLAEAVKALPTILVKNNE